MINQTTTKEVLILADLLRKRGVILETEKYTGYMHVDIYVRFARLNIEIDGNQHLIDPKQILADLNREYHSSKSGFGTIHIPNQYINERGEQVADALLTVINTRIDNLSGNKEDVFDLIWKIIKKIFNYFK